MRSSGMRVFVTGASGWIGSAVVPELVAAGHQVTGLARSDKSAAALAKAGASVARGTLDDLEVLRNAAAASDGVVHLAFKHDIAFAGDFQGAADADRRAVETFGEALAGSDRPLIIASGLLGVAPGHLATERDKPAAQGSGGLDTRLETAQKTVALASKGVRSGVMRLSPTVHGRGDNGFISFLVAGARVKGVAGYIAGGENRWPAIHRIDAARLLRLALEKAPAGAVLHASAEEGVTTRSIAEAIGQNLGVPVVSVASEDAAEHFGFLAGFFGLDSPASSAMTREMLGWEPTEPGLIDDLNEGHYFRQPAA